MKLQKIASLLENPKAIFSLFTWPLFSVTSYFMVASLAKQNISPKTIIDVGANVGQFSVATAKLFPNARIHSFEPQPQCVEQLKKNISKLNNIKVYSIALGDEKAKKKFYVNSQNHSSSILPLAGFHRKAFPGAQESGEIVVDVSTLDSMILETDLLSPCLLKLDVQGYEAHVLRGGAKTLKRVDFVIVESSFKLMYEGETLFMDMVKVMEEHGFLFLRPVGWLADPKTDEILQMDALFIRSDTM